MKTRWTLLASCLAATALLCGCGEDTTSTPPSPPAATPAEPPSKSVSDAVTNAAATAAEAVKAAGTEVAKAADATKESLQDASKALQGAVSEAGAAAQKKFDELVAEVKKLVADGKGSEAVQKIQSVLSGLKLTPEQQKVIDDLKKQAQELLSKKGLDAAAKAAGDLLQPKPQN